MLKLSSDIIYLYNNMSHDRDAERKNYRTGRSDLNLMEPQQLEL